MCNSYKSVVSDFYFIYSSDKSSQQQVRDVHLSFSHSSTWPLPVTYQCLSCVLSFLSNPADEEPFCHTVRFVKVGHWYSQLLRLVKPGQVDSGAECSCRVYTLASVWILRCPLAPRRASLQTRWHFVRSLEHHELFSMQV